MIPARRRLLRICRAEFCRAAGSEELVERAEHRLGARLGETTRDGRLTVRDIYCLGMCKASPAVMMDDTPYGSVTPQLLDSLIDRALTSD